MRVVRVLLVLAVALLMVSPALAQEKKKGKRGGAGRDPLGMMLRGVTLDDAQKTKVDAIKKDYAPKLAEAAKKADVLTEAQKKARADALKAAQDAGKSRQEIGAAVREAVKLTDDQKKQQTEATQAMQALAKEMRGKVMEILTPEQKEQVNKNIEEMKKAFGGRGKKKSAQ
jgi:Spy/CpxP family protein refolding chaperone